MKKILFLGLFLFLFTGCYDYVEINEMAIVYGVAVDLQDDEYKVTYEILNTKNKDDKGQDDKVYFANGKGFSISEAFTNASLEIAKTPYLAHLKTVIIDENIAKSKLEDIIDFLLRDNHIRNIFYLVEASEYKAEEILKNIDTNNPIISNAISNLIEHKDLKNNIASQMNFEKFMKTMVDKREDVYMTSVTIDNNLVKLSPLIVFKDFQMVGTLTEEESVLFNLMNEEAAEYHFEMLCPNSSEKIVFSTNKKPKSKMEIEDTTMKIELETELRLIENHCDLDFRDKETYIELQEQVNTYLQEKLKSLAESLREKDTDILRIRKLYYQKNKSDVDFKSVGYEVKVHSIINHNGLIFEVKR